jgi:hypothetical protein
MANVLPETSLRDAREAVEEAVSALRRLIPDGAAQGGLTRRALEMLKTARRSVTIGARETGRRAGLGRRGARPLYRDGRGLAFAAGVAAGVLVGIAIGRAWARGPGSGTRAEDALTAEDAAAAGHAVEEKGERAAEDATPQPLETGRPAAEQATQNVDASPSATRAAAGGGDPIHKGGGRDEAELTGE